MKVLIVTGGIGSGKSQVCRILKEKYGFPVYEAAGDLPPGATLLSTSNVNGLSSVLI